MKHIAYGFIDNGTVDISVFPTFVPKDQLLSQVGQQMNALEIFAKVLVLLSIGPGAGPRPTASAVIADQSISLMVAGPNHQKKYK